MGNLTNEKSSTTFVGGSSLVLVAGVLSYVIGLWNAEMELNEKGYYFTVLMFGLFSAISLQKTVRDQLDGIPVTGVYYGLCWFTALLSVALLVIGLWNADLLLSEKGFYGMAYVLSLYASIAVQKNTRDKSYIENNEKIIEDK